MFRKSSLLPLFFYTPYTHSLYTKCNEYIQNNYKLCVFEDSINELLSLQFITKALPTLNDIKMRHDSNRLSIIRHVLQYFPGNNFGNNSARALSLFILDILDDTKLDELSFSDFKIAISESISNKIELINKMLNNNPIIANPKNIIIYWNFNIEGLGFFNSISIDVLKDIGEPKSKRNKMRDYFHLQLANQNNMISTLLVADRNFMEQFEKDPEYKINLRMNLDIITLNKSK